MSKFNESNSKEIPKLLSKGLTTFKFNKLLLILLNNFTRLGYQYS